MRNLTDKQLAFCNEYVANGYNGLQAYKVAYSQPNSDVCKSEAYNMLRQANIQEGIRNAEMDYRITGHGVGINKEAIMKVIERSLNARKVDKDGIELDTPDYNSQLKAIEVYAKLTGDFSPEKKSIVFEDSSEAADISKMTIEEREEYKKKILAQL